MPAAPPLSAPAAAERPTARAANPLARVEVAVDLAAVRADWLALERVAAISPYQRFAFADAWFATLGAARGAEPFLVVARDETGAATALLPLALSGRGPLRRAEFLGGKDANFNLGLFRPDFEWDGPRLAALLAAATAAAARKPALYALLNQPVAWAGAPNPFAALGRSDSPSFAYKSALPGDFDVWLDAHRSKDTQKKLRKKAKKLAALGPLRHCVAGDAAFARAILSAFLAQKRERMLAQGTDAANAYDSPEAEAFLARLAGDAPPGGRASLELHALEAGERIVACFGALAHRDRLSGLFIGFDGEAEIARCSPGELLVHEVVRSAIARGFSCLDLGVGEARYKREVCEAAEPLFDTVIAATFAGHLIAPLFRARLRVKRRVKQSPRLMALARRVAG